MTEETLFLKQLEGAIQEVQEIPLWGSPPPFPWENFGDALSRLFEGKTFSLSPQKTEWLEKKEQLAGMGKNPLIQPFSLSPLPGTLFLVMTKESKEAFLEEILTEKTFSDETLQEGFFTYLCLGVLHAFNKTSNYGNITATLSSDEELPEEGALCIDVQVTCNDHSLSARIIVPRDVHASFRTHFTMDKPPFLVDPALQSMPLSPALQIGSTTLSVEDWQKVDVGDLILLDRCSYDLKNNRGSAQLSLGSIPLFDVRIKDGEVKILEYAFYQEESPMTDDETPEEEFSPEETPPSMEEESEEAPLWSPEGEAAVEEEKPLLASKNIPITLIVEAGRIKMPLEKLTQLTPGNVLDLSVNPQAGVSLTVKGKCIAKGELVQLGESIGVKILKLGE